MQLITQKVCTCKMTVRFSWRHAGHEGFTKRLSGHQAEQPSIEEGAGGQEHPADAVVPGASRVPTTNRHQTDQVSLCLSGGAYHTHRTF